MIDWLTDLLGISQLPYQLIFGVLAGIGLLFLIIASFADGILDSFDSDGPFSFTALMGAITMFGFGGLAASSAGLSPAWSLTAGAGAAIVGYMLAFWFINFLRKQEPGEDISEESFVGQNAIVVIPIGGNTTPGEVKTTRDGRAFYFTAYSDKRVANTTEVTITHTLGNGSVKVKPAQDKDNK